jgi:hypothetical protein
MPGKLAKSLATQAAFNSAEGNRVTKQIAVLLSGRVATGRWAEISA